jgi:hypothetical protein
MRRRMPSTAPFFKAVLVPLWIYILLVIAHGDEDWTVIFTDNHSRLNCFTNGYIMNKPMLQILTATEGNSTPQSRRQRILSSTLHRPNQIKQLAAATTARSTMLNMCICINCARVVNCTAYYFVETKHEQPHIAAQPTFTPRDGSPTIHVNIRTIDDRSSLIDASSDYRWNTHDVKSRVWSEETKRAQSKQGTTTEKLEIGETIIPISTTYTEYDVVACADYVEDMNCWIRNMPDEIKRANPNFVPS